MTEIELRERALKVAEQRLVFLNTPYTTEELLRDAQVILDWLRSNGKVVPLK